VSGIQLLFAIVQREDAGGLCRSLNRHGLRVTRIQSSGGFLAQGNTTVMVAVDERTLDVVLNTIRQTCQARRAYVNPLPWGTEPGSMAAAASAAVEVQVGGATIFALPLRHLMRLRGSSVPLAADENYAVEPVPADADKTDLVFAIVRPGDAVRITTGLVRAGFRLTGMPTAGAFLRRPNMTLMCAVARPDVDRVLTVIQENCGFRTIAPCRRGEMPLFAATVFVLELQEFILIPGSQE
jgi:uncharacterized protein YaaQ